MTDFMSASSRSSSKSLSFTPSHVQLGPVTPTLQDAPAVARHSRWALTDAQSGLTLCQRLPSTPERRIALIVKAELPRTVPRGHT